MDYKTTQADWQRILNVMIQYNRQGGFIHILDGKLTYFDSNPTIDGVGGFYITISEIKTILQNF